MHGRRGLERAGVNRSGNDDALYPAALDKAYDSYQRSTRDLVLHLPAPGPPGKWIKAFFGSVHKKTLRGIFLLEFLEIIQFLPAQFPVAQLHTECFFYLSNIDLLDFIYLHFPAHDIIQTGYPFLNAFCLFIMEFLRRWSNDGCHQVEIGPVYLNA